MCANQNSKMRALAFAVVMLGMVPTGEGTETIDAELLEVMEWRMVGPFRGGRSVA